MPLLRPSRVLVLLLTALAALPFAAAQQIAGIPYNGMRWRQVGPFRAGRVSAVAGIPGNSAVYYMGTPGGGVWKTTDAGMTWKPIFDEQAVSSIGSITIAESDPKIIYVGTGDVSNVGGSVNQGDGVYRSADGGQSWQHAGLEDSRHIGALWVDPHDPNTVIAAALGHTYAPNSERGVFKTTDGGKSWRKVLYKDDVTGAIDIAFDPQDSRNGLAALWGHYVQPNAPGGALGGRRGGAIYKTTDGGDTWTAVNGSGLPGGDLGRIGVAIAGKRAFAIIDGAREAGGLYRSDDGGTSWQKSTSDPRVQGSGYFSKVFLDPQNPDVVYVAQTSLYRSQDGGRTFIAFKGAPGGDDNHVLWIDPKNPSNLFMGSDQGGVITLNGGQSWSSWYNQPTGQVYHLSTDHRFPYWIYGTQQDSGSIAGLSRGDYGAITMLDWDPIGGYEFGYIVPDPKNPNIVFAGGPGRGLVRIDRTNRQIVTVSPNVSRDGDYRTAVNPPLAFSPQNPSQLFEGTQFLLRTSDAGMHWEKVSPDLTKRPGSEAEEARAKAEQAKQAAEASDKKPKTREEQETQRPPDRTAINTFALSPRQQGVIWAGTTNGLIHVTRDGGKSWQEVSPKGISDHAMISMLEASHFDAGVAWAAVDAHELNDFRAHIYRTHDFGATWQETAAGIPDRSFVRVVREDPARKGLLYAGTETGAFTSFDDGDHWSAMQLNLPPTSVRDLVVEGKDLVAATYGRAFWILDDLTPLRQWSDAVTRGEAFLVPPATALRVQRNLNGDTPIPPDMPAADNPPVGAVIDYYLKGAPAGEMTLAIYDRNGQLVRQLSSKPAPASDEPPPNVPDYWLLRPQPLPAKAGMNRAVWDLRYTAPLALRHDYAIAAIYGSTPAEPQGPLVAPGRYEVRLTVNGHTFKQPLEVQIDPRVHVSQAELEQQLEMEKMALALSAESYRLYGEAAALHKQLAERQKLVAAGAGADAEPVATTLKEFEQKLGRIQGEVRGGGGGAPGARPKPSFALINNQLGSLATLVGSADAPPTDAMRVAYHDYCSDLNTTISQWNDLTSKDLQAVNRQLNGKHLPALQVKGSSEADPPCE